jgi:hypothetical protein
MDKSKEASDVKVLASMTGSDAKDAPSLVVAPMAGFKDTISVSNAASNHGDVSSKAEGDPRHDGTQNEAEIKIES